MSHNLDEKYAYNTEGKAVFFSPHAGRSVYFESSALNWNFSYSDGNLDGRHVLDGIFYYHKDFFNQTPKHPIEADFRVQSTREDGALYAVIRFYALGSQGENDLLGEFVARDNNNIVAGFEGRDERLTGEWNVVQAPAKGKAVFFSPHAGRSVYFESSALSWSFSYSDGDPDGRHVLDGIFYSHTDFFNQTPKHPIEADFRVLQTREGGTLQALIKFYAPGSQGENDLLGEFAAKDHTNTVAGFEGRDERLTGEWSRK